MVFYLHEFVFTSMEWLHYHHRCSILCNRKCSQVLGTKETLCCVSVTNKRKIKVFSVTIIRFVTHQNYISFQHGCGNSSSQFMFVMEHSHKINWDDEFLNTATTMKELHLNSCLSWHTCTKWNKTYNFDIHKVSRSL